MKIDCPLCHAKKSLGITTHLEKIPYFGEVMESTLICRECGYRYSDVLCLDHGDPMRYSLWVEPETLNARVVKSQSATIRIPELGLKVEPGPRSTAYISNIEGVIERFQSAVKMALKLFEDEKARERSLELLEDLRRVRSGEKKVKVVVEDPMGQSFIAHPRVSKRKLTSAEIKKLKTGFITIER
ncbi:MAG TPA: ZPR1 zinc finger domain-containing protein [Methanothermobacter sp.]|jgi:zinc finger protein|nr:ZPR1 zinc finger domain-containing protein [Methanobacteriales archaeon]MDI6882527.1 ZPR1 zinc finger domain-containing protein [Methanothermobacter sp.]MDX9693340.1 ZPR1 zinc finger domain-containing protein [Methanothermobacter sp.]HHW16796.1 ZPR1 zinc finger domain-containing protein [Methanothermobacter sp.]HPU37733.1 ZPR1 zinc finger domain-containing protein [Methanothermobacter sp.]